MLFSSLSIASQPMSDCYALCVCSFLVKLMLMFLVSHIPPSGQGRMCILPCPPSLLISAGLFSKLSPDCPRMKMSWMGQTLESGSGASHQLPFFWIHLSRSRFLKTCLSVHSRLDYEKSGATLSYFTQQCSGFKTPSFTTNPVTKHFLILNQEKWIQLKDDFAYAQNYF